MSAKIILFPLSRCSTAAKASCTGTCTGKRRTGEQGGSTSCAAVIRMFAGVEPRQEPGE
jgi:hypothetical protein